MTDRANILFIINPISGVGKKKTIPKAIVKHLDLSMFRYDIQYTEYKKHGYKIASELKSKYDVIVAIGGDGTVSEIGSALVGSNCALGIIPCGSGNGIARHLKIPLTVRLAIKQLNEFNIVKIDTGKVNNLHFIGTCGFGFDAHIAKKFDHFHKRGFSSYIKLVKKEYNNFESLDYLIDGTYQKNAIMCTIANSSQFGNGFTISPESDMTDSKFELIFIDKVKYRNIPRLVKQFFSSKIHQSKYFSTLTVNKNFIVELEDRSDSVFHIDGEPFDGSAKYSIEILPQSLKVLR